MDLNSGVNESCKMRKMSNLQLRIISAIVMIVIFLQAVWAGVETSIGLLGVVGILTVDELLCNFWLIRRFSKRYIISQLSFIIPYFLVNYVHPEDSYFNLFANLSALVNFFLLLYLFFLDIESHSFIRRARKFFWLTGFFVLFPVISLASLFHLPQWRILLGGLILINCSMDVGAYVIGMNFGKHKLMPKVSPKKTIEGLIGGIVFAGFMGVGYWYYFMKEVSFFLFFLFGLLALSSQIGDLVQSKIKRQAGLKDSSALIPGHGGMYDRIDSLVFVAPFYVIVLKYLHF